MRPLPPVVLAGALLAGCAVGPNYHRPPVDVPDRFYGAPEAGEAEARTLADLPWWEVFEDQQLRQYLGEALENSWDIKIAAARVLQAEAAARVVRSQFFPSVALGGEVITARTSQAVGT